MKRYALTVRGSRSTWSFAIDADPAHVADWRDDGLVVDEIVNSIPRWVVDAGLLRVWIFFEDIFNFRNPWGDA